MIKIVADRDIPFLQGVFEPCAEVVYLDGASISPIDVANANAVITRTRTRCDSALLEGSAVGAIATATIGFDHIDMDYCRTRGISVFTSAGCNARGVLQWMGAVLRWLNRNGHIGAPSGTTLGIVGVGNVGSLVERYARMWGFDVVCCDPPRQRAEGGDFVTLAEVARRSDIVTFHVPLIRSGEGVTVNLAGDEFFKMIKPGAIVINSSRGEVVDQSCLLSVLESGACSCVIDTWAAEPHISAALAGLSLLATPHIAGYSLQGKANATAMVVRSLATHFGWKQLDGWYPAEIEPSSPSDISWDDMCSLMPQYFDIGALSDTLKANPGEFERMRTAYRYRKEFF